MMPKRSKEETKVTIQMILDAVVDQALSIGYDRMSYTTLSQQTGISRTGISHHFPCKNDFTSALSNRIFELFASYLEFDQGGEAFRKSWLRALESEQFQGILRLIFYHIASTECSAEFPRKVLERLFDLIEEKFGDNSQYDMEWLLGKSLIAVGQLTDSAVFVKERKREMISAH
jgi:AcrR family transcriptional regulator